MLAFYSLSVFILLCLIWSDFYLVIQKQVNKSDHNLNLFLYMYNSQSVCLYFRYVFHNGWIYLDEILWDTGKSSWL